MILFHAPNWNGDDRALCGLAEEGSPTDKEAAPEFAKVRDVVTCPDCKGIIAHCQDGFTGNYRVKEEALR